MSKPTTCRQEVMAALERYPDGLRHGEIVRVIRTRTDGAVMVALRKLLKDGTVCTVEVPLGTHRRIGKQCSRTVRHYYLAATVKPTLQQEASS